MLLEVNTSSETEAEILEINPTTGAVTLNVSLAPQTITFPTMAAQTVGTLVLSVP
jgi:hypothetical protein